MVSCSAATAVLAAALCTALQRYLRAPPTAVPARCLQPPLLPRSARQWVPAAQLEAARKCFGTDEDLLLVAME